MRERAIDGGAPGLRDTDPSSDDTQAKPVDKVPPSLVFGLDTLGTSRTTSTAARYPTTKRSATWSSTVFGIGEHHSEDFPMSAGDVVLAAIAAPPSPINISNATSEGSRLPKASE